MISTKAPKVTTFVTLPSTTSPSLYWSRTCCQGSLWVCLSPSEIRCRSRSMSRTFTSTVWPISSTSLGWLTCDQESSEMWIRPSMPSRSTKAPKSTMFEIWPSTTSPGLSRSRIAWRASLRSSSSTPREDDVVPGAVQLDHLAAERLAEELVEVLDAPDVDERRGQEAADAEVEDEAALDDLDHPAVDRLAALGGALDVLPGELEARSLLGEDEPALGVLLGEHERIDLVPERDLVGRVHRAPDREL